MRASCRPSLCAEAADSQAKREEWYEKAADKKYGLCSFYGECWYSRGLHYFEEGRFEKAIEAFERAFALIEKKDPALVPRLLQLEAEAEYHRNTPESRLSSLSRIEKLLALPYLAKDRSEILYLRGLIASRICCEDGNKNFFGVAEESLNYLINNSHLKTYVEEALRVLATLYYQMGKFAEGKELFLRIVKEFPDKASVGEALFWAAECAEKEGIQAEVRSLRRRLADSHPSSPRAAESYFRIFSTQEYLEADKDVREHLLDIPRRWPGSPFLVPAYYLLGKAAESPGLAQEYYSQGLEAFQKGDHTDFRYFYRSTLLESALLCIDASEQAKAHERLAALIRTYEGSANSLYPELLQQAHYALARNYLCENKEEEALAALRAMIPHFQAAGITEGHSLFRAWNKQGKIALKRGDFTAALRCFEIAEDCGEHLLAPERKLKLWIAQSRCLRELAELDSAMRMLSKAINEDAASPLRLEAMLLRAEIYELQGRNELAVRQLEALSKKGGDWGKQAEERLKGKYGL